MRYMLSRSRTLLLQGPASFRVLNGNAVVLGGPVGRDRKLIVRQDKQLPIEAKSQVDMEIQMGEAGSLFEVDGSTIPRSWEAAAGVLEEMSEGKVIVIGATDVGKSTLCAFLTNEMTARQLEILVVDADIGQADIGPPTTMAKATPSGFLTSLVDLDPRKMIFVGHTSPGRVESKLIDGLKRLVVGHNHGIVLINTDGWVADNAAILYKLSLIDAVKPDLVIGISSDGELHPVLSASRTKSLNIEASQIALTRSRTERRGLRNASYRRFLDGGSIRSLYSGTVRISAPKGLPPHLLHTKQVQNLIVGLLDEEKYLLQIGVLLGSEKGVLRVYSREAEGARELELGYVRLLPDGTELGYLEL